jgi:DNA helicase HerA-like ATPase
MKTLKLAEGVSLPIDAVTQAIGIVAKRRVGKSYTARRFAEQLLNAGQQVVIVDPKGDWWGIRSSADGKAPGFPVVILGGEHGDVPLEKAPARSSRRWSSKSG